MEARKKSIAFYRSWCSQQRDLLKVQRTKLDTLGKSEYFTIKKMAGSEKDLENTIETMRQDLYALSTKTLDQEIDTDTSTLGKQRREMTDLHTHIEHLEDEIEQCMVQYQEVKDFELAGGLGKLEGEIQELRRKLRGRMDDHLLELEKVQRRHDASVVATGKRKDRILAQLEAKANQQEVNAMSPERVATFLRNKSLKERLSVLQKEFNRLTIHVQDLEQYNMKLVHKMFDLDWNLMYGKDVSVLPVDEDDGIGDLPLPILPEKTLPPVTAKYHHLQLHSVDKAVEQVLQKQEEWQQQDLFTMGVLGAPWQPRKTNPLPLERQNMRPSVWFQTRNRARDLDPIQPSSYHHSWESIATVENDE
ncbi:hypothetical protein BCR33DRAFT_551893 [Rhizoclosmatium globosum]|uniref:Uncharacterized protein n=1 Tax=Rhizoclosmatium globosum TaxID=329046 RepID=A0A1Y2CS23_9FUNG|nr:hypothetical protein BCR33DRAFT_551893 [Rhizoclosmatium globosum]|eukprot:ORY49767.1 hypothetical protein BCR33DRAFT_551893 [Rhizoclosmatium globosum]